MEKIYCISGMGADERIFKKLTVPNCEFIPLPWLPYEKNDDIQSYARKMSEQVPGDTPIFLGLSYGGMLSVEIGKIRQAKKIFLVSSAKTTAELPQYGQIVQSVIRDGWIPGWYFNFPNPLNYIFAGAKSIDDMQILATMAMATDGGFIKWALRSLLTWNNTTFPPGIVHIHGTADLIIPPKNVHPTNWIKGGTHVMVYNRAGEINKIIADNL